MMGDRQVVQGSLFYEFSIETHVPSDHLLRSIDRFADLAELRAHLAPFYSSTGRPSIDPELMIRMLIIGYCFGIRSERRLCDEVHLNLAYRWFCRLGLEGRVPDHSTFSKNRHGRFRDSDLLRRLFEVVLQRCVDEGLVGGEAFAVDASLIKANANRQQGRRRLGRAAAGCDQSRDYRISRRPRRCRLRRGDRGGAEVRVACGSPPPGGPEPTAGWPTSLTGRANSTVTIALSNRDAAREHRNARSCARSMKAPATWPGTVRPRRSTRPRAARSKCCSPT